MKRYWILAGVTTAVLLALVIVALTKPVTVDVTTLTPQTAVKTELLPAVVVDGTHLQLFVRESLASAIRPGQPAAVSGAGLSAETYAGAVTEVADRATVKNGKTGLSGMITLDETDDSVKPGLTATARVTVATVENALVLRDEWISEDEDGAFVLVTKDGRAARRAVVLGETVDGGTLATGVLAGEAIIVDPAAAKDGQRVRERGAP